MIGSRQRLSGGLPEITEANDSEVTMNYAAFLNSTRSSVDMAFSKFPFLS